MKIDNTGSVEFSVDITSYLLFGRSLLRVHPDGGDPGTEGCIGLTGNAASINSFADQISDYLQTDGTMRLVVNYGLPANQLYP